MMISFGKRFFFVANTKTASTSIERVLLPYTDLFRGGTPARKHTPMLKALQSYPFLFRQPGFEPRTFFRFGVMRDPMDWIVSWFRYRKGDRTDAPIPEDMDFETFWRQADWNIRRKSGEPHLQRDMFCNKEGAPIVDLIIPYQDLGDMFGKVCDALSIPAPLPRDNVSTLRDSDDIPEALRNEMREHYAPDYDLWARLPQINEIGMRKLDRMARDRARRRNDKPERKA